jgi:EAL domain-containing protein (putative c-di-GMP-specific phosphodiesterase class I)
MPTDSASDDVDLTFIRRIMQAARAALGMDIAWLSAFDGPVQWFRVLDSDEAWVADFEGISLPLEGSYCEQVLQGGLPNAVPDVAAEPRVSDLAFTRQFSIASYAGVPVRFGSDRIYGMLCCISTRPSPDLGDGHVRQLEVLASVIATELSRHDEEHQARSERRQRIVRALEVGGLRSVFQPIVELRSGTIVGAEALSRFDEPPANPEVWFSDAAAAGLGHELELAAVAEALRQIDDLPPHAYVALNASPDLLVEPAFHELVSSVPLSRIVLEITEHAAVQDYDRLCGAVETLRAGGARLAIDDAGAGYSSFRHVLRLRPDIIKLDMSITRDVDQDPVRQALASALVSFARVIGASIVAEGVETQSELDQLLGLGVGFAQGYFLQRPGPLPLAERVPGPTPRLLSVPGGAAGVPDLVATAVAEATDVESLTRPLLEAVIEVTRMETAYFSTLDPSGRRITADCVLNAGSLHLEEGMSMRWENTFCKVCRELGILWTAEAPDDLPGADLLGIQSFLSIPVVASDSRFLGTLCAVSTERRYIGESVLNQLRLYARLIADRVVRDAAVAGNWDHLPEQVLTSLR